MLSFQVTHTKEGKRVGRERQRGSGTPLQPASYLQVPQAAVEGYRRGLVETPSRMTHATVQLNLVDDGPFSKKRLHRNGSNNLLLDNI